MSRSSQTPQPAEPNQHVKSGPRRHARIAGAMAAALVMTWGGPAANAFWQTMSSNAGAARADSIPAVAAPAASVAAGAATVSWSQGTTAAGRPVAGYTVARYSAAAGGTKVAAGGGCAGTVTALTCNEAALPAGTWYYIVTPVLGAWAGVESARSGGVNGDSTAPAAPTISAPAVVNIANAASVPVSGTAEAGSSVTISVTGAGTAHTASQTITANTAGQWTAANFNLTTFPDGIVTYTAVAADIAGNASAPGTASSTKDTVAPTAKVILVNKGTAGTAEKGDVVNIQFSEPMDLPSICSSWVNGQQPAEMSANGDIVVTINGTDLNVTRTKPGCALNIGTVSLGASYANSGSLTFQGSGGNASKITWSSSSQTLTITLGQRGGSARNGVAETSPTVVPPTGVKDLNGNQAVGAPPLVPSQF